VEQALEHAHRLTTEWDEELRRELPADAAIFDAHTHLGLDIDGMSGELDQMLRLMDAYGVGRAFTFCLDEPDRHPGFRAPNDRVLAWAAESGGRVIPFVRLDLSEGPIEEAERCLDRGARGIKLHPRAQRFLLNDERLSPVFALAAERRVPILIHGGRGLPPIADDLAHLVERYPDAQLIIAHAGIADLAGLAGRLGGKPGVYFDTSVWSPIDLLDFMRLVSPEQILYASDYPYGQQPNSLILALRVARVAGLNEAEVRGMLAGNAGRIAEGESQPPLTPPRGSEDFTQPMVFARIHQYICMATPLLWTRQPDTIGVLGLALNACEERNGSSQAELERIRALLACAQELWRTLPELEDEREKRQLTRIASRLIYLADVVAATPGAA
jgi:predicted TIM-barrel fold metal-dependent hydrolase